MADITLVLTPAPAIVAVVQAVETRVVQVGMQGPPGPPGNDAGAQTYTAAVALSGHRMVQRKSPGVDLASPYVDADIGKVFGMTTGAAAQGAQVSVQLSGEIVEPSWNWTLGQDVYLGANGIPTQMAPVGAVFIQIIGYPSTPTSLVLTLRDPIHL